MRAYVANVFGWTTIIEAKNKTEAVREAKQLARGASLLPSDVNESHVRTATEEDKAWFEAMTTRIPPAAPSKPIRRMNWAKEAPTFYRATREGGVERVDSSNHESGITVHVFVIYEDGTTNEWNADDGKKIPSWATSAIEWATGGTA